MREIKCRGYNKEYDKWIIGSYVDGYIVNEVMESNEEYITIGKWAPVDVESVGQYTGVKDKNGVEIYEGDILKYTWAGEEKIDHIMYDAPMFTYRKVTRWSLYEDEVIGNIYENPELLEVIK